MSPALVATVHAVNLGFIDYVLGGRSVRLPVQFFDTALGKVALLLREVSEGGPPLLCMVVDELVPVDMGDVDRMILTYADHFQEAQRDPRFAERAGDLLELFRWLHTMCIGHKDPQSAIQDCDRQRAALSEEAQRASNTWSAFHAVQADPALQRARLVPSSSDDRVAFLTQTPYE